MTIILIHQTLILAIKLLIWEKGKCILTTDQACGIAINVEDSDSEGEIIAAKKRTASNIYQQVKPLYVSFSDSDNEMAPALLEKVGGQCRLKKQKGHHVCSVCGKDFTHEIDLNNHLGKHLHLTYKCTECKKNLNQ